jgi:hypothetical protein
MSNNHLNLLLEIKTHGIDADKATQKKALAKLKPSDSPFKLASLFRAKKDVRYYLNAIYSDGENLIASDGHAIIKINHTVPAGWYHDNGIVNPDMDAKFPDFMRVYNTKSTDTANGCNPLDANNEWYMMDAKKPYQIVRVTSDANKDGIWFNADYIDRARRAGATAYYLCEGSLYFTGPNFDGFVMHICK